MSAGNKTCRPVRDRNVRFTLIMSGSEQMDRQHIHPSGRRFESGDYSATHAERFAARYDDGIRAIKVDKVLGYLGEVRGRRLVDLGCGIGYFASTLTDRGACVVACDFAEAMVDKTQQRYADKFPLVRASVENPPFRDACFDAALLLDVFEHLYNPQTMLTHVFRLLKPGGRLVLTTDRPGFQLGGIPLKHVLRRIGPLRRLYRALSKEAAYETPLCTHVHEYGVDEVIRIVEGAGFMVEAFDTYPNRARYGLTGRAIELVGRGPLRKYEWEYAIYAFNKPMHALP